MGGGVRWPVERIGSTGRACEDPIRASKAQVRASACAGSEKLGEDVGDTAAEAVAGDIEWTALDLVGQPGRDAQGAGKWRRAGPR